MKLTLDNFENHVPFRILARGLDYFESGAVVSLEEVSDGEWDAEVVGSKTYEVEVTIEEDGSISWNCDCPYDMGDMCKHVVAVLLAIREEMKKQQKSAPGKTTVKKNAKKVGVVKDAVIVEEKTDASEFERLLTLVKAEELKLFAKSYAQKHPQFQTDLSAYIRGIYVPKHTAKSKDYCKEVKKAFQHTSRSGYSRYDYYEMSDWDDIFDDIDKLFDEARLLTKAGNAEAALDIAVQFLLSMDEEFDDSITYDEDIDVTYYCEQAESIIMEAVDHPSVSQVYKEGMLKKLKSIPSNSGICDYYDFDLDDLILQLTIKTQSDEKALELIDENIKKNADSYNLYSFVTSKIQLLQRMNRMDEADRTMDKYLYLPRIRQMAVDKAVMAKQYDDAISLITDGIAVAKKKGEWVTERDWMEKLLHIYELQNDTTAQAEMSRRLFVFVNGSLEYYQKLKKLIPTDKWKPYLQQLLHDTKMRDLDFGHSTLGDIYVEEKDWDALFKLVSASYQRLDALDNYSYHLRNSHSSQLLDIYVEDLQQYASKNVGRNYYERIAKAMTCMQKLQGGKERTAKLANEFRMKYKKRPAMMDTLSRF